MLLIKLIFNKFLHKVFEFYAIVKEDEELICKHDIREGGQEGLVQSIFSDHYFRNVVVLVENSFHLKIPL